MEELQNRRIRELLRFTETHNRHREALAKATGEHFNIFRVLGVGHLEVKTHSPILVDLLNPQGSHGQSKIFLDLFLDHFNISDFDSNSAFAKAEQYIGRVTEDSGGQIDIVIQDGSGKKILIENKIHAGDQKNQLTRYRNFDANAHLFYLTLFASAPSNLSKEQIEKIHCHCISYAKDIHIWLQQCRKEAACIPRVREILSQYITLIEELTYQSTNIQMNENLIEEIVRSPQSFKAFQTIRDAEDGVKKMLISKLDKQLHEVAQSLGLEMDGHLDNFQKRYRGFSFKMKYLSDRNLKICFLFDLPDFRSLIYGFAYIDDKIKCEFGDDLRKCLALEQLPLQKFNGSWPAFAYFDSPYHSWGNEAFEGVRSGQFAELVRDKVEKMVKVAKSTCGGTV